MIGHRICAICKKTGHKRDMVSEGVTTYGGSEFGPCSITLWKHPECYTEEKANAGYKRCECGKNWILDKKGKK